MIVLDWPWRNLLEKYLTFFFAKTWSICLRRLWTFIRMREFFPGSKIIHNTDREILNQLHAYFLFINCSFYFNLNNIILA